MAKIKVKGMDEEIKRLNALGAKAPPVFLDAVYTGGGMIADEVRRRLDLNLSTHESVALAGTRIEKTTTPTGDLAASLGVTKPRMDAKGVYNVKIGFHGYDRKGVPNQLKARVMESGSSTIQKRPFIRPALRAKRKTAQQAMEQAIRGGLMNIAKE